MIEEKEATRMDSRVQIDPSAKIAPDVKIGPWTIIGPNVVIGAGSEIGSHVYIEANTKIGQHNKIFPFASIGSAPQHLGFNGEDTFLEIGDHNVIREYVTINRGTKEGDKVTRVGSHNYFMSCAHVAHDCRVGNHTIFANTASIAGFVTVGDHAILGAFTGVHQFVNIGAYSFMGRATKIYNDILPYMLVAGNPGVPHGLNLVGLKRNGFSAEARKKIKEAYSIIYRQSLMKVEIIAALTELAKDSKEVKVLLDALTASTRGIAR